MPQHSYPSAVLPVSFEVRNSAGEPKMNSVEGFVFIQRLKTLCTPAVELRDASQALDPETTPSTPEVHVLLQIPENVTTEGG